MVAVESLRAVSGVPLDKLSKVLKSPDILRYRKPSSKEEFFTDIGDKTSSYKKEGFAVTVTKKRLGNTSLYSYHAWVGSPKTEKAWLFNWFGYVWRLSKQKLSFEQGIYWAR